MELRRQAEAAEANGAPAETTSKKEKVAKVAGAKKKAAPRAKRTRTKAIVRKRLVWGVFSSSMKEEGRFPYSEREAADARAAALVEKHKRKYFVQPIKEVIGDKQPEVIEEDWEDEVPVKARRAATETDEEEEEEDEVEIELGGDDDDDE